MIGLLKVIFFVLILTLLRYLFSKFLGASKPKRKGGGAQPRRTVSGRMVKDPQCGTYVATELAVPGRTGGQTLHFCSRECRDEFLRISSAGVSSTHR